MCPTGTAALTAVQKSRKPDLRSAFDVLDVDGDGKISPDDLRTFYGDYNYCLETASSSSSSSEKEDQENKDVIISSMISMADENKDGFVEYEEFEKVLVPNSGMNNYLMENVFRVMDKDGDGKVGYEDLKSYLISAGFDSTDDEDVKAMIRLAAGAGGGAREDDGGVSFDALLKILFL